MYWQIVNFLARKVSSQVQQALPRKLKHFGLVVILALFVVNKKFDTFETKCHFEPSLSSVLYGVI